MRAVVLGALFRTLATDERRLAYWRRHLLIGIALSEVSAATGGGYALLTDTAAGQRVAVVLALVVAVMGGTPLLLLLPLARILRHPRGAGLFYAWSIAATAIITTVARLDGGMTSPLTTLLFLTLAYMALAYPPAGVLAMGGLTTAEYLLVICPPHLALTAGVVAVVMAAFTAICTLSSANSWRAHDEQQLLLRTQQLLAATDPLTGVLNRRAFLDRLRAAVDGRAPTDVVVCLIDLDGFKSVNDSGGHAAGDAVLIAVSRALTATLRTTDTIARLGGDEFAVLAAGHGPRAVAHLVLQL